MSLYNVYGRPSHHVRRTRERRYSSTSDASSASLNSSDSEDREEHFAPGVSSPCLFASLEDNRGFLPMAPFPISNIEDEESSEEGKLNSLDPYDDPLSRGQWRGTTPTDGVETEVADHWDLISNDGDVDDELHFSEDDVVSMTDDLDWDHAPFDYDAVVDRPWRAGYASENQTSSAIMASASYLLNTYRRCRRNVNQRAVHCTTQLRRQARAACRNLGETVRTASRLGQAPAGMTLPLQTGLHRQASNLQLDWSIFVQQSWPQIYRSIGGDWVDILCALVREGVLAVPPRLTQHAIVRGYRR